MPRLSRDEQAAFLAERGVLMRIATVTPEGRPYVTPIWFVHENGTIYFTPRQHSAWLAHLRVNPAVALSIDEDALPYRKVVIEADAVISHEVGDDDAWRDLYRRIARRYVDEDAAVAYVEGTIDQPRALCRVDLVRAHVRSWRMPVDDEDGSGIWAGRYYAADSLMDRARRRGTG